MELIYDEIKRKIFIKNRNGKVHIVEEDFPSRPMYSPNSKQAVYIAPLEWETIGDIYLYDSETNTKSKLIEFEDEKLAPKDVIWLDDENLAMILGLAFGTIDIGGNIFTYNLRERRLKRITEVEHHVQFTSLYLEGETLIAKGIEYVDEQLLNFEEFKKNFKWK